MILDSLKFVQGGVSRKNLVPVLSHYFIREGRITSYNGELAISAPIDLPKELEVYPKASVFFNAIEQCNEATDINILDNGHLKISSGKFKAVIPCMSKDDSIEVKPTGKSYQEFDGQALYDALQAAISFVGNDASRPWSNGILFQNQTVVATSNAVLIQIWVPETRMPELNLPAQAVRELLRVKRPPSKMQIDDNSVTFYYPDTSWIRCHLLSTHWPNLDTLLDSGKEVALCQLPHDFFEGLESILQFTDKDLGSIYLQDNAMCTHKAQDVGAVYTFDTPFDGSGCFNGVQLMKLKGVANAMDFTTDSRKCSFFGDNHVRGFIAKMRSL